MSQDKIFHLPKDHIPGAPTTLLDDREFCVAHEGYQTITYAQLKVGLNEFGYLVYLNSRSIARKDEKGASPPKYTIMPTIDLTMVNTPRHGLVEPDNWRFSLRGALLRDIKEQNKPREMSLVEHEATAWDRQPWDAHTLTKVATHVARIVWADSLFRFHNS